MNTSLDCFAEQAPTAVPVELLTPAALDAWRTRAEAPHATWVSASGFDARPGSLCLVPDPNGALARVLVGGSAATDPFVLGDLSQRLPDGAYRLEMELDDPTREAALLGFALGAYRFTRYRKAQSRAVRVLLEAHDPCAVHIRSIARAVYLARDLINTPAQDMMPGDLAAAAETLAGEFAASYEVIVGEALLTKGFPAIHAVGRASTSAPRLLRLDWGRADAPCIAVLGKGVCFDSGGLDIKPASGMRLMKKDMGGAAHALALARLIMERALDVRLLVLVPAVENAIAGNAMRPGDVLATRQGLSIEIDNTDAEGRLVLSDALTLAGENNPALIIDFATLTGAARVAVGTELAAMFCNDEALAQGIQSAGARVHDPLWRLPLYRPYAKLIESKVADIANSSGTPHGGAITAALFLERFIPENTPWAHFDIMAWNTRERPGRPEGGEAMGLRAVFDYLESRFGNAASDA